MMLTGHPAYYRFTRDAFSETLLEDHVVPGLHAHARVLSQVDVGRTCVRVHAAQHIHVHLDVPASLAASHSNGVLNGVT